MPIKHVLLDIYKLVLTPDPKFVVNVTYAIAELTKQPWEACTYAVAESANYFRSLDIGGAFVCDPLEFACDVLIRLESHISPYELVAVLTECGYMWKYHVTDESVEAVRYMNTNAITVSAIGNTNLVPVDVLAVQCMVRIPGWDMDYHLMQPETHIAMPYDALWTDVIANAGLYHHKVTCNDILFITTNGRYARAAERAGLQVAVISNASEIIPAIKRRQDVPAEFDQPAPTEKIGALFSKGK